MNNNKNNSLKLTDHARERAQERNISFDEMSIVYQYGTSYNVAKLLSNKYSRKQKQKIQTKSILLRKKDLEKLPKPLLNALPKDSVRKLHNIILLVSFSSKVVITAYRDYKLHSVKNIEKHLAEKTLLERLNGIDQIEVSHTEMMTFAKNKCVEAFEKVTKIKQKHFRDKYFKRQY